MYRISLALILLLHCAAVFSDDRLWSRLENDANMVVLLRNAESQGNRDGANMLAWDASGNCTGESVLTAQGKAHAARIGAAFVMHGIDPVVISSPMCRCRDTARIAFGEVIADPDLRQAALNDAGQQQVFKARANALLREHRGAAPLVFVNHRPNIDALTLELIGIGELLVGTIDEDGGVEVVGRLHIE